MIISGLDIPMVNIPTPLFEQEKNNNIISFIKISASFENETIDKTDKQYSTGTKKLNQNSKHVERIFENIEGPLKKRPSK